MGGGLPSKKVLLLIIACTIGVGSVGFAVFASKNPSSNTSAIFAIGGQTGADAADQLQAATAALKTQAEQDDDNDGLANWEENLWNTNPKNADTDGDGTNDGDEVNKGRNPLVAGPNDKVTGSSAGTNGTAVNTNSSAQIKADPNIKLDDSETAQVSRSVFATYMDAKRSGVPINAQTAGQIIKQAVTDKSLGVPTKTYVISNLTFNNDSSADTSTALKNYGNALGQAFYAGKTDTSDTEITVLNDALVSGKKNDIAKLDPIIAGYGAILNQLAAVPVPRSLMTEHLTLLNTLAKVHADIKGFRVMFDDPMVGLSSVGSYYNDLSAFQGAVAKVKAAFTANNVTFSQNDIGSVFMVIQ